MHVWDTGCGDTRPGTWGCVYEGTWGLGDMGTLDQGCGVLRIGDVGRWEAKGTIFLLQINIKYNFQRIQGRSFSEGPSEHRQTTLCLCAVFTVGTWVLILHRRLALWWDYFSGRYIRGERETRQEMPPGDRYMYMVLLQTRIYSRKSAWQDWSLELPIWNSFGHRG